MVSETPSVSERIDGVERSLDDRLKRIEVAADDVGDWKPKVDATIDDMRIELGAIRKTVNRVILDSNSSAAPGIFVAPAPVAASPYTMAPDGPSEHRVDTNFRENAHGSVYTHTHSPGKGTFPRSVQALYSPEFPSAFATLCSGRFEF